jgi:CRP-like cAMP-binding protein
MKSLHWKDLLRRHPIFSSFTEAELSHLLTDEASHERTCGQDTLVIRSGDLSDSVFVIGAGSVQVTVLGTVVAILKEGEFFGEIAALERKPRSASVTARERCTLLEVQGEEFRKLLEAHPDIAATVRAQASARLSQSGKQQP